MYKLLDKLASEGAAILMISNHIPELFGVADRLMVMHRGRLGAARPIEDWTEDTALIAAAGGSVA